MDAYETALSVQEERDLASIEELLDLGSWPFIAGASDAEAGGPHA